jgi:signal transduction histidine kinase
VTRASGPAAPPGGDAHSPGRPLALRLGAALLFVAGATLVAIAARALLTRSRFSWFFLAVLAAALYGGFWTGVFALALSLVAMLLWLDPIGVSLTTQGEILSLVAPAIAGVLVSWVADAARRARILADQRADEAQRLAEHLEEARRELEDRSASLLAEAESLADIGSWEWDVAADRVSWSPGLYRLFGLEPGEPVSYARYLERLHPDDRATAEEAVRRAMGTHEPFAFDHRVVRADGEVRQVTSRGRVAVGSSGAPARLYGVAQDVTAQRAAAEAARRLRDEEVARRAAEESQRRLAFLARASELLASSLDFETTLRSVARLCVPTLGDWAAVDLIAPDGSLRRLAVEHADPEKVQLVRELEKRYPSRRQADVGVHHVLRTGRSELATEIPEDLLERAAHDAEHLELIRALGLRSYVIAPLVARGEVLGAITVVHAESGRRFAEEDRELVEDLARRAAVAIENARLVHETLEARDQLEGQAQELELQAEELRQTQEEMEVSNEELRRTADELRDRSRQLELARAAAEDANRAKSDFLAMMSHELRTPLNAIGGYAQLLEMGIRGPVTAEQREDLGRIHRSQEHLLGLINDILNYAKLEAGRVSFDMEPVVVREAFDEVHEVIAPLALERALRLEIAPCDEIAALADRDKLQQILINLLSNAVKFTPRDGTITLACDAEGDRVRVHVRDTGVGIPDDKLDAIFEPFVQVGKSSGMAKGGTGLGLAISRDLARLMQGELTVRSRMGEGTEFTLALPRA